MVVPMLEASASAKLFIADKADDVDRLRTGFRIEALKPSIPARVICAVATRSNPAQRIDAGNVIERMLRTALESEAYRHE